MVKDEVMHKRIKFIYLTALSAQDTVVIDKINYPVPNRNKLYYAADLLETQKSQVYTELLFKDQWCVYILELIDGSYYTGIAKNLEPRLEAHRMGVGSKYVRGRLPFNVIYIEFVENRSDASKMEYHIKQLKKRDKHLFRIVQKEHTILISCNCGLSIRMTDKMHKNISRALLCPACNSTIRCVEDEDDLEWI